MLNDWGHMRSGLTEHRRGLMLILSAPSGAGKTTLTQKILAEEGDKCCLSTSATTRSPRSYEIEGQHYFFLSYQAFEEQRQAGAFLEWAEVFGHLYGTPKKAVEDNLTAGRDVLFDIDWQGARQLAENCPADAVRVFILPPSREELESRLRGRASESDEAVARRLAGASEEMRHWNEADYVIINDDIRESLHALRLILHAERLKRARQEGLHDFVLRLLDM